MIYNKKFKHHRLVSSTLYKDTPTLELSDILANIYNIGMIGKKFKSNMGTYSGKINDDQKFKIKVVGVNKVRIEDGIGRALMNCRFSQPGESDDEKIWELRA